MSKTYCPIPWVFQAVRNNGDIRLCCQANVTKNKGVVRHPDGTPFNAGRDDMTAARNAELMREVRKNMLQGVWSAECGRCQKEEEAGLNSRRQYELENWDFSFDDAVQATDDGGVIESPPLNYYDLRFGNLCNLACRMCGPTDSHTWYEQWVDYHNEGDQYHDTHGLVTLKRNAKGRLSTTDYDWHGSENFWNQIEANIDNIEHVYMAGGEPMMIERHYEFLQKCIDLGRAPHIIIEYNTNMTTLPNRVIEMWTHFKQVRVGASVDGMGTTFEYQRWPGKWAAISRNLTKLDELCQSNSNVIAWLAVTVTAYNAFHIPEFMWWKLHDSGYKKINSTRKRPVITHHVAHHPKRTNVGILCGTPHGELLRKHYQAWEQRFDGSNSLTPEQKDAAKSIMASIIKYMDNNDHSKHLSEFRSFTRYLDQKRGQNLADVSPQLGDLLDE